MSSPCVGPEGDAGEQRERAGSAARRSRGRGGTRRHRRVRDLGRTGKEPPRRTASALAGAPPAQIASRVGYPDARSRWLEPPRRSRGPMFRPVSSKPDLVAQEHEILAEWRERRTFARLRAQNADGPRWSFLDGPITANNPMGVHHAWGRAYKDVFQRFHAMLGENERYQNGFDCQGLWVEVNVERDLGFTNKRDIEAYGIAEFVTPMQAARPDLRRAADRAVDPARDVDGLERPARAAPAARPPRRGPGQGHDDRGARRTGHRHRRDARRTARHEGRRRQLLHVQQREQRPDLGLPRGVPPPRPRSTRATTRCRGAPAAARVSPRWR